MTYYVSITGLNVKSAWHLPKFFRYTLQAKQQAEAAEGNVKTVTTYYKGIWHTLTIWKDRKSMTKFMATGAHARAMKINKEVSAIEGTKVYGYESETIPSFREAYALWDEKGALHGKLVASLKPKSASSSSTKTTLAPPMLLASFLCVVVAAAAASTIHQATIEGVVAV